MYTPEINFLKDRPPETGAASPATTSIKISRGVTGGLYAILAGTLIAAVAVGATVFAQITFANQLNELERTRDKLVLDLKSAQKTLDELTTIKRDLDTITARISTFQSFFNTIQPWSSILQDLRSRVPKDVWLQNMAVSANSVTIRGQSLTFEQVNDLQLTLLQSPFVTTVALTETRRSPATAQKKESVSFSFTVGLKPLALLSNEVLDTLKENGSEGLAAKIVILRNLEAKLK